SMADEESHHDLVFGLRFGLAQTRFAMGCHAEVRELGTLLLSHARTGSERAAVRSLLAELHVSRGTYAEAVAECLDGLRALGAEMPEHPTDEEATSAAAAVLGKLMTGTGRTFTELPAATDPRTIAVCDLLSCLIADAIHTDWNLVWIGAALSVEQSLSQGN